MMQEPQPVKRKTRSLAFSDTKGKDTPPYNPRKVQGVDLLEPRQGDSELAF